MRRALIPYAAACAAIAAFAWWRPVTIITVAGSVLLLARFIASSGTPPRRHHLDGRAVVAVVPVFNENPDIVTRTVTALLGQTRPPDRVIVVDDGSDRWTYQPAAGVEWITLPSNRGKRAAVTAGMRASPDADVWVLTDSDTALETDAVAELAGRIGGGWTAATGMVLVANRTANWLTRLQDVQYTTAFAVGRGAQSAAGAVLVCSGALAAYDAHAIRPLLDEFEGQTWRGQRVDNGDDRRLTTLALRSGKTCYVPAARAWTEAPDRLGVWVRQQVRWARSWARESFLALNDLPVRSAGWWMTLVDLSVWTFFAAVFVASVGFAWWATLGQLAVGYAAAAGLLGPVRSIRYLTDRTDLPVRARVAGLLLSPAYSLLYMAVGLPIRLYATVTMGDQRWGTRRAGSGADTMG